MEDSFLGHSPLAGSGSATYHLSRRKKSNLIAKPQISKLSKSSENLKGLLQALKYSLFNLPGPMSTTLCYGPGQLTFCHGEGGMAPYSYCLQVFGIDVETRHGRWYPSWMVGVSAKFLLITKY